MIVCAPFLETCLVSHVNNKTLDFIFLTMLPEEKVELKYNFMLDNSYLFFCPSNV